MKKVSIGVLRTCLSGMIRKQSSLKKSKLATKIASYFFQSQPKSLKGVTLYHLYVSFVWMAWFWREGERPRRTKGHIPRRAQHADPPSKLTHSTPQSIAPGKTFFNYWADFLDMLCTIWSCSIGRGVRVKAIGSMQETLLDTSLEDRLVQWVLPARFSLERL